MTRTTHDRKSPSGFRRIRLLAGKFAFLILAAFAARTAWGDGRIYVEDKTAKGIVNANGQLVVECGLGYLDSSNPRVWDFNIAYGLVGGTWSTNLTMHTTPALTAERWYFMVDGGDSPSFVSDPIPGWQAGADVWYQVTLSNTLYNGSAPAAADRLDNVHDIHYAYGAYNSVDISYDYNWTTKNFIMDGTVNANTAYAGVRLTYGRSVDYLAYPGIYKLGSQRGCTVITYAPDGSMTVTPESYYQEKYASFYAKEDVTMQEETMLSELPTE